MKPLTSLLVTTIVFNCCVNGDDESVKDILANLKKKREDDNVNEFDIWNNSLWKAKNQEGIMPGEIKFCHLPWHPYQIEKDHPVVVTCKGYDLLYLSYQVHLQQMETVSDFQSLNDHFAVVVTYGDECANPAKDVKTAKSQADCHNWEEYNVIKGEKCVRRQMVVNTFDTNTACYIVYCTNHRSHCKVWITSYWNKYVYVNPSFQTLKPPVSEMLITGRNLASRLSNIKIRCKDEEERILNCSMKWVNIQTGEEAIVRFDPALDRKHTGKIFIRIDSDNTGWTKEVTIGHIIDEIYPWISMTIFFTTFLIALIPVVVFMIYWQFKFWKRRLKLKTKVKKREWIKLTNQKAENVTKYDLPGWD